MYPVVFRLRLVQNVARFCFKLMEKMSAVGYSNAEQANKDMEEWLAKSQKERERKEELVTAFKEGGLEHLK